MFYKLIEKCQIKTFFNSDFSLFHCFFWKEKCPCTFQEEKKPISFNMAQTAFLYHIQLKTIRNTDFLERFRKDRLYLFSSHLSLFHLFWCNKTVERGSQKNNAISASKTVKTNCILSPKQLTTVKICCFVNWLRNVK